MNSVVIVIVAIACLGIGFFVGQLLAGRVKISGEIQMVDDPVDRERYLCLVSDANPKSFKDGQVLCFVCRSRENHPV